MPSIPNFVQIRYLNLIQDKLEEKIIFLNNFGYKNVGEILVKEDESMPRKKEKQTGE